jgi:hypothetical protein
MRLVECGAMMLEVRRIQGATVSSRHARRPLCAATRTARDRCVFGASPTVAATER